MELFCIAFAADCSNSAMQAAAVYVTRFWKTRNIAQKLEMELLVPVEA